MQAEHFEGYNIHLNNSLDGQLLVDYAIPIDDGREILNEVAKQFRLSMQSYNRVLRVARTIADLDKSKWVHKIHIAEALSYRQMDFAVLEAAYKWRLLYGQASKTEIGFFSFCLSYWDHVVQQYNMCTVVNSISGLHNKVVKLMNKL